MRQLINNIYNYKHIDLLIKIFDNLMDEDWGRDELNIYYYVTNLINKVPYGKIFKTENNYLYMDRLRSEVLIRRIAKDLNLCGVIDNVNSSKKKRRVTEYRPMIIDPATPILNKMELTKDSDDNWHIGCDQFIYNIIEIYHSEFNTLVYSIKDKFIQTRSIKLRKKQLKLKPNELTIKENQFQPFLKSVLFNKPIPPSGLIRLQISSCNQTHTVDNINTENVIKPTVYILFYILILISKLHLVLF